MEGKERREGRKIKLPRCPARSRGPDEKRGEERARKNFSMASQGRGAREKKRILRWPDRGEKENQRGERRGRKSTSMARRVRRGWKDRAEERKKKNTSIASRGTEYSEFSGSCLRRATTAAVCWRRQN
jgi:hypothetical protein